MMQIRKIIGLFLIIAVLLPARASAFTESEVDEYLNKRLGQGMPDKPVRRWKGDINLKMEWAGCEETLSRYIHDIESKT